MYLKPYCDVGIIGKKNCEYMQWAYVSIAIRPRAKSSVDIKIRFDPDGNMTCNQLELFKYSKPSNVEVINCMVD